MTTANTLPSDLTSKLTQLGAMERDALSTLQGWMPPRLAAARECALTAARGAIKPSDAHACFAHYAGNKMPPSAKVQISKLAQFITAGVHGFGAQTIDAVGAYFQVQDAKVQGKFTGADRSIGNAYETTLRVIRGAIKLAHAPSHDEIAAILAPKANDDDTVVSLLESAKKYADSALGEAPEYKDDLLVISQMLAELAAKRIANIGAKPDTVAEANTARNNDAILTSQAEAARANKLAIVEVVEVEMEDILQVA